MKINFLQSKEDAFFDGSIYSFVNPCSMLSLLDYSSEVDLDCINFFVDGISLVWAINLLNKKKRSKVTRCSFDDTSLAPVVFSKCVSKKLSVALVGGIPGVVEKVKLILEKKYDGLLIDFCFSGFSEDESIYHKLLSADIVICGMGAGRQESFLSNLKKAGWSGTGFTCGGYFDQLLSSDGRCYYPEFIDHFHLRWLYRLYKEPARLLPRYFVSYPKFFFLLCIRGRRLWE